MACAIFYPVLVAVALWALLHGDELRRGRLTVRSLLVATTLAGATSLFVRWVLWVN